MGKHDGLPGPDRYPPMNQAPEIAERLRERIGQPGRFGYSPELQMLADAADLITTQAAEIERLKMLAAELCDQIADAQDHGDEAFDDTCPICIAHSDLRAALSQDRPPLLVGLENQGDSSLRQEPSHPAVKDEASSKSGVDQ